MAGTATVVAPLVERDDEIKVLVEHVAAACTGTGRVVVISGPAGIGKTALLRHTCRAGADRGMRVLTARASELERDYPFALLRQLFDRLVLERGADVFSGAAGLARAVLDPSAAGDAPEGVGVSGVLHGVYWLTADLAVERPLLLAVDDVQWADPASLRTLAFLGRRIDDLPLLLVVTERTGELVADPALLAQVTHDAAALHVQPRPLTDAGAEQLLTDALGEAPSWELTQACQRAAAGNPLLLRQLAPEVRHADPATVPEVGPPAVAATVMLRIGRMSEAEPRLARALAVLGGRGALAEVASLAGLDADTAGRAADHLARADILELGDQLDFVHPIVRAAVYRDIDASERGRLHREAAALQIASGRTRDAIPHLVAAPPRGDVAAVEQLRAAAGDALAAGDHAGAATLLERALAEPPAPQQRWAVLGELGLAQRRSGSAAAVDTFTAQLRGSPDARSAAAVTADLARALLVADRAGEAIPLVERALAALGPDDRDLALELHAVELNVAIFARDPALIAPVIERSLALVDSLVGASRAERALLGVLSNFVDRHGADAEQTAALARRALAAGALLRDEGADSIILMFPIGALFLAERYDEAHAELDALAAEARRLGSVQGYICASAYIGHVLRRRGELGAAEAENRAALDLAREHAPTLLPGAVAFLVDLLTDAGRLAEAEQELVAAGYLGPIARGHTLHSGLVSARGRLRLAQARLDEALADLMDSREREEIGEGLFDFWGPPLVRALALAGRREEALAIAEQEVTRWRAWGTPRALGTALAARGVALGGAAGIAVLQESTEVLARSAARLDLARAHLDLGSALRRNNQRTAARHHLRVTLDLARRCGADGVAEAATAELRAAGGRVRREAISGAGALTASELRVARLAADGLSNREIAQSLFLSRKTVEMHLGRVYRKLDVSSREGLPGVLPPA